MALDNKVKSNLESRISKCTLTTMEAQRTLEEIQGEINKEQNEINKLNAKLEKIKIPFNF